MSKRKFITLKGALFLSLLSFRMSNLITSAVFSGRKDPSPDMLRKLVVSGGRQQIKAWLAKCKYGGDGPVALPVFTLDTATPRVKGARWHLQGRLREVGVYAKDLFNKGTEKLFIKFTGSHQQEC